MDTTQQVPEVQGVQGVQEVQGKPKTVQKRKRATTTTTTTTTDADAGDKKKRQKSKNTVFDKLGVIRKKEINQIAKRVAQTDMVTPAWLNNAIRICKQHCRKIDMMSDYKDRLTTQFEAATSNVTDDVKKERMKLQYDKKIRRCDEICKSFKVGIDSSLRANDVVFLSKIHVHKPLSGYMMYAKENRDRVQKNNPGAKFGEIGRLIGVEWKALTNEQREEWKQKAVGLNAPVVAATENTEVVMI
jgi:hypothetical protein